MRLGRETGMSLDVQPQLSPSELLLGVGESKDPPLPDLPQHDFAFYEWDFGSGDRQGARARLAGPPEGAVHFPSPSNSAASSAHSAYNSRSLLPLPPEREESSRVSRKSIEDLMCPCINKALGAGGGADLAPPVAPPVDSSSLFGADPGGDDDDEDADAEPLAAPAAAAGPPQPGQTRSVTFASPTDAPPVEKNFNANARADHGLGLDEAAEIGSTARLATLVYSLELPPVADGGNAADSGSERAAAAAQKHAMSCRRNLRSTLAAGLPYFTAGAGEDAARRGRGFRSRAQGTAGPPADSRSHQVRSFINRFVSRRQRNRAGEASGRSLAGVAEK